MPIRDPKPTDLQSSTVMPTTGWWPQPYTQPQTYTNYPTTYTIRITEDGRLRFALELIAAGNLRKEDAEKIAKHALAPSVSSAG